MPPVRDLDLARFKTSNRGLTEFATLLEQAPQKQRERIIEETKRTDPEFLRNALKRAIFFDELPYLEEGVLTKILAETPSRILACALRGTKPEFKQHLLKHLEYRQMKATLDEEAALLSDVSPEFTEGAQLRVLRIARELEDKGKFVLELFDCPRLAKKSHRRTRSAR